MTGSAFVYSHYDAAGRLLYVGVTSSLERRMAEHKRSPWAPCIAKVRVRPCRSRAAALAAEAQIIESKAPVYNRVGGHTAPYSDAAKLADALGRAEIAAAVGVGFTAVSNAVVRNRFPSSWFLILSEMAEERGVAFDPALCGMKKRRAAA